MFFVAFAHSHDLLRHLNRRRSRASRHDQQPPQLAASSMDGCVDDQDYNDGAQNDHPIGKLNARYRCLFAKPFHDYPPIFKQRLTKGEAPTEGSGPDIVALSSSYRRWPYPPVCRPHLNPLISFGADPSADNATTRSERHGAAPLDRTGQGSSGTECSWHSHVSRRQVACNARLFVFGRDWPVNARKHHPNPN